ncbi:MAG: hypothetical protein AAF842_05280 [Planctomycetota bacterium]
MVIALFANSAFASADEIEEAKPNWMVAAEAEARRQIAKLDPAGFGLVEHERDDRRYIARAGRDIAARFGDRGVLGVLDPVSGEPVALFLTQTDGPVVFQVMLSSDAVFQVATPEPGVLEVVVIDRNLNFFDAYRATDDRAEPVSAERYVEIRYEQEFAAFVVDSTFEEQISGDSAADPEAETAE